MVPGAGIEPARLAAGDFESPASTNFTTRASQADRPEEHRAWQKGVIIRTLEKFRTRLAPQEVAPTPAGLCGPTAKHDRSFLRRQLVLFQLLVIQFKTEARRARHLEASRGQ